MSIKKRIFTRLYKESAVKLSYEKNSTKDCATQLGIEVHFIQRWRREYKEFGEGSFCGQGTKKTHPSDKPILELEKRFNEAELRYEILKAATPYMGKGNEEILRFMRDNRKRYILYQMCEVLNVEIKKYYRWEKNGLPSQIQYTNSLKKDIIEIFNKSKKRYGSAKITLELHARGYTLKQDTVSLYMRKLGLKEKLVKKKKRSLKVSTDNQYIAPNILNRNFCTDAPCKVWASDITYIQTTKGFIYLTIILDLYDRKIVGWHVDAQMTVEKTIVPAWEMAIANHKISNGLIFHSDRGTQYANKIFSSILSSHNCIKSMSRKWKSIDNAVCEGFFGNFKRELIHSKTKLLRRSKMKKEIQEYIENWYNTERIHSYLNYQSIEQFNAQNTISHESLAR